MKTGIRVTVNMEPKQFIPFYSLSKRKGGRENTGGLKYELYFFSQAREKKSEYEAKQFLPFTSRAREKEGGKNTGDLKHGLSIYFPSKRKEGKQEYD